MTTQAIQSPANILPTPMPASGNSSAASGTPELPFNQVLQREVTERRSAEQSAKSEPQQADTASARRASTDAGKPESVKEEQDANALEESSQEEVAAGASAELLALVASMTQLASAAAGAQTGAKDTDAQAVQIHGEAPARSGKKVLTDIEKLQGLTGEQGTDRPIGSAQEMMTAAPGKDAEVPGAGGAQQLAELQLGASPTGNASVAAVNGLADKTASGADTASILEAPQTLMPVQQAANRLQAGATQAAESLAPQVGTTAWDQAVGQKVVWMVNGAQQSASLTLNPPELGPMQIMLNVTNAQANATFVAAQPEVRQALEAALPRLREMLGEAGIQLGQTNINAGTPQQGGGSEQNGKPPSSRLVQEQQGDQPPVLLRQQAIRQGVGMVDTFA